MADQQAAVVRAQEENVINLRQTAQRIIRHEEKKFKQDIQDQAQLVAY